MREGLLSSSVAREMEEQGIIKDADDILSSVYFKVKVYENVYDENGILATPQYSELQEAIKKARG